MAKKILILLLAAAVMASFAACHSTQSAGREKEGNANENWKIGIITGPASLQEEAFRAAEQLKAKYGEHRIVTATYPDAFYVDAETVAACMADMAADKDVEAIVFVPAIPGAASAIDEVRKTRPDMLFVCGTPVVSVMFKEPSFFVPNVTSMFFKASTSMSLPSSIFSVKAASLAMA